MSNMKIPIFKQTGEKTTRDIELSPFIFDIKPNDHSIYLDVKRILANRRQGTHSSKEKGDIKGSTRKLRKQKGTGGARVGSIKSPIFRGGGRIFGPSPRDYTIKLNKKLSLLARKSALSYKQIKNGIIILEDFNFSEIKTKNYMSMLKSLSLENKKVLLILNDQSKNIVLSGRNIPLVKTMTYSGLNTYDVLYANKIIFLESSLSSLDSQFKIKA